MKVNAVYYLIFLLIQKLQIIKIHPFADFNLSGARCVAELRHVRPHARHVQGVHRLFRPVYQSAAEHHTK